MNPRELRIGNFLQDCISKVPYEVTHNTFSSLVLYIEEEKEAPVEPIPLTEEWLLKFDFTLKSDIDGEYYEKNGVRVLILRSDAIQFYFGNPNTKEKFVHELQNYFFIMTGKELDIHLK